MNTRFALAMARRELRSAWRRFLFYGACMAIGIAAVVGLHALRSTVKHAIGGESQKLLGSDLRIESRSPIEGDAALQLAEVEALADTAATRITRFASMALIERSQRTRLVDVQAVAGQYPFYGEIQTQPAQAWPQLSAGQKVALVDTSLLVQLDAQVGDELVLGAARFPIVAVVTRAPGAFGMGTQVAPRVFIARRYVDDTGLVQRGSLVEHIVHIKGDADRLEAWLDDNQAEVEASGLRTQTVASYQEGLTRSFSILTRYLGLIGLAALALGSVGVAAGVRVFLREKLDSVALLRSIGARPKEVVATYALLALALGVAAGLAGVLLGYLFQLVFPYLTRDVLPFEVALRMDWSILLTGVGLAVWATLVCALGPLVDLAAVAPLRALRRDFGANEGGTRRGRLGVAIAVVASAIGASVWQAPSPLVGLAFAGGLFVVTGLLALCARGLAAFLRKRPPRNSPYWFRQGIANLFRPRNHTLATTVAVGFSLFLISTLHSVGHNVLAQIAVDTTGTRPNLVLFDVQSDQRAELLSFLEAREVEVIEEAAIVSGRLSALDGVGSAQLLGDEAVTRERRWALRREYQLSYAEDLREGETVASGAWWSEKPPLANAPVPVSIESRLAKDLGVEVGDSIRWEIQGVPLESRVTSIRRVDWGRLGTNFFVLFPPWALADAPQRFAMVARAEGEALRAAVQRDLVGSFPNVSSLDASVILRAVDAMLGQMASAVRVLALFTLATGLTILAASASAARSERAREGLLLRTLGAAKSTVRRIVATEALALGFLAAAVGSGLAVLSSWIIVTQLFELSFSPPWLHLAILALATLGMTALLGATSGWASQRESSPFAALREAERSGFGA